MCDIKVTDEATVSEIRSFSDCIQLLVKRQEEDREDGNGLSYNDLNDEIFEQVCKQKGLILKSWRIAKVDSSGSIHHTFMTGKDGKDDSLIVGFRGFEITGYPDDSRTGTEDIKIKVMMKSKALVKDTLEQTYKMGAVLSPEAGEAMKYIFSRPELTKLSSAYQVHEIRVAERSLTDDNMRMIQPTVYYTKIDPEKDQYYFIMEHLDSTTVSHLDIASKPGCSTDVWDGDAINKVLGGIVRFHAAYLDRLEDVQTYFGILLRDMRDYFRNYDPLIKATLEAAPPKCPEVLPPSFVDLLVKLSAHSTEILDQTKEFKNTLCHGDFTPRNMCLRRDPKPGQEFLCVYDWEGLNINIPQMDLVEFLIFALPADAGMDAWLSHVEFYRKSLEAALSGRSAGILAEVVDTEKFNRGVDLALMTLALFKLSMYSILLATGIPAPFAAGLFANVHKILAEIVGNHDFLN